MINAKDLWVGDWLSVVSSGQKGRFQSILDDGTVVLRLPDDHLLTFAAEELDLIEEENPSEDLYEEIDDPDPSDRRIQVAEDGSFSDVLDLHYEVLSKKYLHDRGSILEYQKLICEKFIDHAIRYKLPQVSIIHGVGQGILKKEVEDLLKLYPQVALVSSNPNQASIDVWLNS